MYEMLKNFFIVLAALFATTAFADQCQWKRYSDAKSAHPLSSEIF
jgi:hypothetical protein